MVGSSGPSQADPQHDPQGCHLVGPLLPRLIHLLHQLLGTMQHPLEEAPAEMQVMGDNVSAFQGKQRLHQVNHSL